MGLWEQTRTRCTWRDGLAQAGGTLPEPWREFCVSLRGAGMQHQICMDGKYWPTHVENGLSGETGFRETGEEDILILPAKTDDRRWGLPEDQWGKREKEARDSGSPGSSS